MPHERLEPRLVLIVDVDLLKLWLLLQISHIIREIRQFQQTAYKIDLQPKVNEV